METIRKITDEFAIAGPITDTDLLHVANEGFQSVVNLRSLSPSLLRNEKRYVEDLGLSYLHEPIDTGAMTVEIAARVLRQLDRLPRPVLIYCNNATLAAAITLMHIATRQGETLQQAFKRAEELGLFMSAAHPLSTSSTH